MIKLAGKAKDALQPERGTSWLSALIAELFKKIELRSLLRLRGVFVADTSLTQTLIPFVLLLRSNEDLQIIARPPWWSTGHVIAMVITALLFALIAVILYQWHDRAGKEQRLVATHRNVEGADAIPGLY